MKLPAFDITAQTFYDYSKVRDVRKYSNTIQGALYKYSRQSMSVAGGVTGKKKSNAMMFDTGKTNNCLLKIDNSIFLPDND